MEASKTSIGIFHSSIDSHLRIYWKINTPKLLQCTVVSSINHCL